MNLNSSNYYSKEANKEYLSVSQYKDFYGSLGENGCEAMAMSKIDGTWEEKTEDSKALMVGSYVDSHFEGTLDLFKAQHPDIFLKSGKNAGSLKADYVKAEEIINRIERDKLFMAYMSGEKQRIMIGEIGGATWKIKIDSYIQDRCIVDLKIMKSLRESFWIRDTGNYANFIEKWGYDIQGAVYQEIVRQNTGKTLPFFIAAASKEKETDLEVIHIPDERLHEKLIEVENNVPNIMRLKQNVIAPVRCECCDYCKHTKILKEPISMDQLLGEI